MSMKCLCRDYGGEGKGKVICIYIGKYKCNIWRFCRCIYFVYGKYLYLKEKQTNITMIFFCVNSFWRMHNAYKR